MRPSEMLFKDVEMNKMFKALTSVLVNLSLNNFVYKVLEGTTNLTPDTKQAFHHELGSVPSFWFPQEGRVYVPKGGLSETSIDLRSPEASEPFRILIIK